MRILRHRGMIVLLSGLFAVLSACGLLPDRTKEYQYSQEIPSLEVPPDLTLSTAEQASSQRGANGASENGRVGGEGAYGDQTPEVPVSERLPRGEDMPSHLVVNNPYPIAWRLVGKALARMALEITDRDRSTGYYYVLYEVPEEEQGFWSSLAFWKGDEPVEEEYRIKLEDNEGKTEVFVLDDSGTPLSKGTGLLLLKQMHEQIKGQPADSDS
jgi:outer membrane protein assembly factor BamC